MSEVKAIEAVDNALGGLSPEERVRVLSWAQLKYGASAKNGSTAQQQQPAQLTVTAKPQPKTSKKSKTVISMDKSLNLSPPGKTSATEFAAEKSPTNLKEKSVVAVSYLRDVIEMEKVTFQAVFTYFKHVQWPAPADLKNTLQQAGTAGWLDTADSEDIKLTSLGENLVEHNLPVKAKTK
jgi:hypothetical protein